MRVQEPVFESQTKTKLGSLNVAPDGLTMRSFVNDFVKKALDNYLHQHPDAADAFAENAYCSQKGKEKKLPVLKKIANERAKKANLHNKKTEGLPCPLR